MEWVILVKSKKGGCWCCSCRVEVGKPPSCRVLLGASCQCFEVIWMVEIRERSESWKLKRVLNYMENGFGGGQLGP